MEYIFIEEEIYKTIKNNLGKINDIFNEKELKEIYEKSNAISNAIAENFKI